jgi:type IV secretory pathway protease TraF
MSDVKRRLQLPASGLIIVGALNAMSGVVLILGRLASLVNGPEREFTNDARRLGYLTAIIFIPLVSLISIIVAPVIIYGGIQMLKARKYSLAMFAAILALIPVSSICCIPGIPIGIWALVVLRDPEVRAIFESPQLRNG